MKKIDIKNLVCPHVLNMQAYSSARMEYEGKEGVFLDANENPFGCMRRVCTHAAMMFAFGMQDRKSVV